MSLPEETSSRFGGFRQRTVRFSEWIVGTRVIARNWREVRDLFLGSLEPALREAILIAVSDVNACRWCSWGHQAWGRTRGLDDREIEGLTGRLELIANVRVATAGAYARARADARFGQVPASLREQLLRHFDEREATRVEIAALTMNQTNLCANALDALRARWRGTPPEGSRLTDDLLLGAIAAILLPPAVVLFAIVLRRSPVAILRDLRAFLRGYSRGGSSNAKAPA